MEKESHTANSREHILLVDDEPDLLAVNSKLLSAVGYQVSTVSNGQAAIDLLSEQDVDLIVLDMVMPGMDGEETLKHIREMKPDQKVVILSGFAEKDKVEAVRKLGVYDYLNKPFDLQTMIRTLRNALDGKAADAR